MYSRGAVFVSLPRHPLRFRSFYKSLQIDRTRLINLSTSCNESASRSGRVTHVETAWGTFWVGSRVDPRAALGGLPVLGIPSRIVHRIGCSLYRLGCPGFDSQLSSETESVLHTWQKSLHEISAIWRSLPTQVSNDMELTRISSMAWVGSEPTISVSPCSRQYTP